MSQNRNRAANKANPGPDPAATAGPVTPEPEQATADPAVEQATAEQATADPAVEQATAEQATAEEAVAVLPFISAGVQSDLDMRGWAGDPATGGTFRKDKETGDITYTPRR